MKRRYFQIVQLMKENEDISQRDIAKNLKISLAYVNKILFDMEQDGLLYTEGVPAFGKKRLTQKAFAVFAECKVDNAIIMAAGFGSRFVPLTYATPKGLLEIFGERMIERQIKQLKEAGINDITVVVGYLKDTFEYLTDKYGVKLLFNPDFKSKNNLSTLYHARKYLKNTYILSSDNWLRENMYHSHEYDSWYSSVKIFGKTKEWVLRTGLHDKILTVKVGGKDSWVMYGPVYFSKEFSKKIVPLIEEAYNLEDTDDWYWEDVYRRNLKTLTMFANKQKAGQVYEFESLDEIRLFDSSYLISSHDKWLELISSVFKRGEHSITNLQPLHFGMTNKSFLFQVEGEKYIFRIPGEGTNMLINRKHEHAVYTAIAPLKLSDKIIFFDSERGVKITKFMEGVRNADPNNSCDLKLCMQAARTLHSSNIKVEHEFNFEERINYYEKLANEKNGILYNDYLEVREMVREISDYLKRLEKSFALTHIDLVPDNLLISENEVYLIDWEYAGMCDPLADLAMFSIYSYYENEQIENLMNIYFEREPSENERLRVYCYVVLGGFLWALWTSYKQALGIEFGDYGLKMYRYAKDYYKKIKRLLKE
ncbi:phosphotransferase [Treponema pedis]|uniref:phosphotransferase n=1 Tax=Treponema pedis TaxID=409322 RepID=UPI003D1EAF6E